MKNIFTQRLVKILLLMFICCPTLLTQTISFVRYDGGACYGRYVCKVETGKFSFIVKEDYCNDELLEKLKCPPYSTLYSFIGTWVDAGQTHLYLNIKGNLKDMNILDHYLKFEKEEFVERVVPYIPGEWPMVSHGCNINGQILYNGNPLSNHIINVTKVEQRYDALYVTHLVNSITDDDGNYIVPPVELEPCGCDLFLPSICTLSFKIGNTVYDTTFVLDEYKIIDFNVTPTWKEFEVKGHILQNGEPLINRTVTITDQFDFVCSSFTDKNGNYIFPYMREDYNYTLSFEIGDTKYDTTFVLDENKSIDFNLYAPTSDIKGKILKDGKPLNNHTIYTYNEFNLYNCTTDENGNYTFPNMVEKYDYTLFFRIGDTRYDTTFVLDGNKNIDFNSYTPTFDVKGQILHNGKPLNNHTINLVDPFDLVYSSATDDNGNYIFPKIIEKYNYTLFFEIGDTKYDTTFVLDEDKVIVFDIYIEIIGINDPEEMPTTYSLSQNYPNPFNPTTTIQYSIPKDEFVKLTVYDITGKVVKELVNGYKTAGKYSVEFNASSYSSGTYYYKLEAGGYNDIQKMMLIK